MSVPKKPKKAARRHRRTATEKEAIPLSATMKCVLWALPITMAAGLLLLLLSTALLLSTKDPDRYHTAAALAVLYCTAFLGGLIAVRLSHRRSPLLCGLCEAVLLILLFLGAHTEEIKYDDDHGDHADGHPKAAVAFGCKKGIGNHV